MKHQILGSVRGLSAQEMALECGVSPRAARRALKRFPLTQCPQRGPLYRVTEAQYLDAARALRAQRKLTVIGFKK